jgi:hypothetical protein
MLKLLTTDEFAQWFATLDDDMAEDVATLLGIVEELGLGQAAPGSRETLLWYEHPLYRQRVSPVSMAGSAATIDGWIELHDYAKSILRALEAPRFTSRLARLDTKHSAAVFEHVKEIKRVTDPRAASQLLSRESRPADDEQAPFQSAIARIRRAYFAALEAAGLTVNDVPAHSLALREVSRRVPGPPFRLLYGVHAAEKAALFVLGERLDRSFYGDSVRRAEKAWSGYLSGTLEAAPPARAR